MAEENKKYEKSFLEEVKEKENRKMKSISESSKSLFFGLGMFGLVGWAVVIPSIFLTLLGSWIDKKWPSAYSWSLTFLFFGVVLGCYYAWHWIESERKKNDDK